jgi:trk system potassium uptake protein TrkH
MTALPLLGRGRRARRQRAVEVGASLQVCGTLLKYLSVSALFPLFVALGYGETWWIWLAALGIAAAAGLALERVPGDPLRVGVREGFLIVSLTWLLAAAFGALPYMLSGEPQLDNVVDAYFEAMSGFTTTGASILTDIPDVSHSLLMWRQFTQWIGGMGIIVLALAVLPRLRIGGRQLLENEMPGPEMEPLTNSIRSTAQRLWLLYVALTAIMALVLAAFGWTGIDNEMGFFDAVAHAFSTLPTGGFSTRATGVAEYAAASQWVVTVFMLLAGINFALLYRAMVRRQPRAAAKDEELRVYLLVVAVASAIILVDLLGEGVLGGEAAVRHAIFQVVSIMTTTGFGSTDFALWPSLAAMVLVALMFVGGSAGSTSGSIKVVRHIIVAKILRRELDETVHPEIVSPVRINRRMVDDPTLRAVLTFVLLYVGIFSAGAIGLVIDATRTDTSVTPFEAIAAAATTLGNVGPGFGFAGPFGSFDEFSPLSKVIMIVLMWLGRLEILPIVILLTPRFWRR